MSRLPEMSRFLLTQLFQSGVSTSSVNEVASVGAEEGSEVDMALVEELLRAKRQRSMSQRRLRQENRTLFPLKTLTHSGIPA